MNEKITLTVHGRNLTIERGVLEELLENKFQRGELIKELENYETQKANRTELGFEISIKPAVGKAFLVRPMLIDRSFFGSSRRKKLHEVIRLLICQAFDELDKYPEKYSQDFVTIIPKKTWNVKTVSELQIYARENKCFIANWVYQVLEWAQRIQNGETWDDVCVYADYLDCRRIVLWNNGFYRKVGDTLTSKTANPATHIDTQDLYSLNIVSDEVPLLVRKV